MPLLERLKFLSIFSTNLDEFFMIRVSGLLDQIEAEARLLSPDGLTSTAQLQLISERLRPMLQSQSRCLLDEILPGLERAGIRIVFIFGSECQEQHTGSGTILTNGFFRY